MKSVSCFFPLLEDKKWCPHLFSSSSGCFSHHWLIPSPATSSIYNLPLKTQLTQAQGVNLAFWSLLEYNSSFLMTIFWWPIALLGLVSDCHSFFSLKLRLNPEYRPYLERLPQICCDPTVQGCTSFVVSCKCLTILHTFAFWTLAVPGPQWPLLQGLTLALWSWDPLEWLCCRIMRTMQRYPLWLLQL